MSDFELPADCVAWRDVVDKPPRVHYEHDNFFGPDTPYRVTLPRVDHPLDPHLADYAERLRRLVEMVNRCEPSDVELCNPRTLTMVREHAYEAGQLSWQAANKGADTCLVAAVDQQLEAAYEWIELAETAQMLGAGDWADHLCTSCAHWRHTGASPQDFDGFCHARQHARTGTSNACHRWVMLGEDD